MKPATWDRLVAWIDRVTPVVDAISTWSGKAIAWLIVPMFAVLFYEVTVRKLGHPTLWANDIATMAYGAHFFLAGAYTLKLQKHIRTDFLSRNWSLKTQVRMEFGYDGGGLAHVPPQRATIHMSMANGPGAAAATCCYTIARRRRNALLEVQSGGLACRVIVESRFDLWRAGLTVPDLER